MSQRIPASERTREALSDLIEGRLSSEAERTELVHLATRLIGLAREKWRDFLLAKDATGGPDGQARATEIYGRLQA
jgi:hypothetical protein